MNSGLLLFKKNTQWNLMDVLWVDYIPISIFWVWTKQARSDVHTASWLAWEVVRGRDVIVLCTGARDRSSLRNRKRRNLRSDRRRFSLLIILRATLRSIYEYVAAAMYSRTCFLLLSFCERKARLSIEIVSHFASFIREVKLDSWFEVHFNLSP